MLKLSGARLACAALIAIGAASPALATQDFTFGFTTVGAPLFGGPGTGSGVITTDGVTFSNGGYTAQTITGITGLFNGSMITNLASPFGANNIYYLTGPSFVDGSGLGFQTAAGTNVNLFFQSSASSYRINTTNPFTSSFVSATSAGVVAAVPEPATWAMMLVGFGAIGFAMRRRRSAALRLA